MGVPCNVGNPVLQRVAPGGKSSQLLLSVRLAVARTAKFHAMRARPRGEVSSTQRRCAQPRTRAPRCDANTGRSCRCPDAYCVSLRAVRNMKTTGATLTHTALSRKAVRSTVWYVLYSTVLKPYSKICTVGTKSFLFTFYATWPFLASVRPEGTGSATNSLATVP